MREDLCIKGATKICEAVGENPKDMLKLVEHHGLPAWKRDNRGAWRALPKDLSRWLEKVRDRNMPL